MPSLLSTYQNLFITLKTIRKMSNKTISGREINATPNHSKKTFTIRTGEGLKYRTYSMDKKEFESCLNATANDWQNFLNGSDYYRVN